MGKMSNKIGPRDVVSFFKNADVELSELVLELGAQAVNEKRAAKEKIAANLAKARKAKGKKGEGTAANSAANTAANAAPATQAEAPSPIAAARARQAARTAGATAAASDELV